MPTGRYHIIGTSQSRGRILFLQTRRLPSVGPLEPSLVSVSAMVSVLKTLHQVAPQREHGFANELGFCTRKGVLGKEQGQGRWTRGSSGRLLPLFVSSEKLSAFSGLPCIPLMLASHLSLSITEGLRECHS